MSDDLRKKYKIKDTVKGVVITGVDAASAAADKRLTAGDDRRDRAGAGGGAGRPAEEGRRAQEGRPKTALLLVATAEGDLRFVALPIE